MTSNEPIKNLTEQILNKDEINIKLPVLSDNSIKSFVWKHKEITLKQFYNVLCENDLILSTSTYQKFKKCFDGSVVNEPYEFNTSEDKDIIYLIYLLRNDDYIERNGFYPVKKLIKVFKIKTDYESVKSIISSMVSDKEIKIDSSGNQTVNILEFNQTKVGKKRFVKINNIFKNLK